MQRENDFKSSRIRPHTVQMDNRERVTVTAVLDVESFNEDEITIVTESGTLVVAGNGLHITKLNLDDGLLAMEGEVSAIEYTGSTEKRGGGFFGLFR